MSGCRQRASLNGGVFSKLVVNTLNTPFGMPACVASSAIASTERGVSGDGLTIIQQPAASAAPAFLNTILEGRNTSANVRCHRLPPDFLRTTHYKYSRNGEIPRDQRRRYTDGLLNRKHPPPSRRRLLHRAHDALRLSSKPPRKAQRVIEFGPRLSQRLTRLVRHDVRQILLVLADQRVPF